MEEVNVYNTYVTNDENKKIYYLDVDEISDFPDHPYHVIEDENLMELSESIKKYGVMVPLIVRLVDNKYQMVAGHRRKAASILAEQYKVPCIIKELSDEDAIITMVDSNIQRENILPSEKAFAYKMRMDAIKRKGGRPRKNNVVPLAHNFQKKTSRQLIGEQLKVPVEKIQKYFSPGTSQKTMEKTIMEALEMYYRLKVQERRKK